MTDTYNIDIQDPGLVIKFKTEVNIKLASVEDESERENLRVLYDDVLYLVHSLSLCKITCDEEFDAIIDTFNDFISNDILSPLTLADDEFIPTSDPNVRVNKRYYSVKKWTDGRIYDEGAYKVTIAARYTIGQNNKAHSKLADGLYIVRNGIVTGEYINRAMIREKIVARGNYFPNASINITCSHLDTNEHSLILVDADNPKLRALREFYETEELVDEDIARKGYRTNDFNVTIE